MPRTRKQAQNLIEKLRHDWDLPEQLTLELTVRIPGLEALVAKLAERELAKEERRNDRDTEVQLKSLVIDSERLALQRLELEQRAKEWELDKREREARLEERKAELERRAAERGKDSGL